jgi:hypothetical protein
MVLVETATLMKRAVIKGRVWRSAIPTKLQLWATAPGIF